MKNYRTFYQFKHIAIAAACVFVLSLLSFQPVPRPDNATIHIEVIIVDGAEDYVITNKNISFRQMETSVELLKEHIEEIRTK